MRNLIIIVFCFSPLSYYLCRGRIQFCLVNSIFQKMLFHHIAQYVRKEETEIDKDFRSMIVVSRGERFSH